ncbi:patatin-like phospholipase family protein [Runella salmonicolor]|uniref:Patatin-like phospholipase family protein n=1 Tax=Runella salmonicolor TaxID=2950278 RepID=A0ABT1FWD4_9BACT|nr:patatin-like phospholipase family protein [Runella salmonicolor]MCP1384993.1 patatin-like phospholipase family protein [Runella salmonicolor]
MKTNSLVSILKSLFEYAYTGLLHWWGKFTDTYLGRITLELARSIGSTLRFVFLHPYTLIVILLLQKLWLVLIVLFIAYAPLGAADQAFDVFFALVNEQRGWAVWAHVAAFLFAITVWFSCRLLFIFFDLGKVLERIAPSATQRDRIHWLLQKIKEVGDNNNALRQSVQTADLSYKVKSDQSELKTEEDIQDLLDKIQSALKQQGDANAALLSDLKKVPAILRSWDAEQLQLKNLLKGPKGKLTVTKTSPKTPVLRIPNNNLKQLADELQQLADQTSATEDFLRSLVRWTPPILGLLPFFLLLQGVGGQLEHLVALAFEIVIYFLFLSINENFLQPKTDEVEHKPNNDYLSLDVHFVNQLRVRYKIGMFLFYLFYLTIFLFFASHVYNIPLSRHIGTVAIYFVGMGLWTYLAFTLLLLDNIHRAPVTVLVIVVLLFFLNTNNHQIRVLTPSYTTKTEQSDSVRINQHFLQWLQVRQNDILACIKKKQKYPIYIVATEGGGLRAAYWTTLVLGELGKQLPEFMRRTYAISGVSGGSVGAAVYTKMYSDSLAYQNINVYVKSQEVLGKDYLSPLISAFLLPDLLQKLSPIGIRSFDRARYLEDALSKDYQKATGQGYLSLETPFMDIWRGKRKYEVPSLFLNCTRVETGEKAILSNLAFKNDPSFGSRDGQPAIDVQEDIARNIRVSTAAFMSARFPVVTPPATIQYPDMNADDRYNIVDGGYVDNSGLETAVSILSSIQDVIKPGKDSSQKSPKTLLDSLIRNIHIHLIMIKNSDEGELNIKPIKGLYELKAPLSAFFNSWDIHVGSKLNVARKYLALSARSMPIDSVLTIFDLNRKKGVIPLGWFLSDSAQTNLKEQAEKIRELKKKEIRESLCHCKK